MLAHHHAWDSAVAVSDVGGHSEDLMLALVH
eukprot:SAG11_NODE_30485_length_300_cov_1.268657_1_plen_30_part_10